MLYNQQPQPQPLLPFPQKDSNTISQMRSQHPLSELLPKKPKLLPFPQQQSKIMSQIMEPHPHPLLLLAGLPHPHPVAVKSLIFASKRFLIMLYHMYYGLFMFQKNYYLKGKIFIWTFTSYYLTIERSGCRAFVRHSYFKK